MKKQFIKFLLTVLIIPAGSFAAESNTPPTKQSIKIFPIGFDFAPMEKELPEIREQLQAQLKQSNVSSEIISFDPTSNRDLYNLFSSASTTNPGLYELKHKVIVRLASTTTTGLYVVPEVIARTGILEGRTVSWDGVKSRLQTRGGGAGGNWSGKRTVFSVCLHLFDSSGNFKQQSCGGISDPYIISAKPNEPDNVLKEHLFESAPDKKLLIEGIRVALKPLIEQ